MMADASEFDSEPIVAVIDERDERRVTRRVARFVFATFVVTFILARVMVLLIMTHHAPSVLFLHVSGTHVHHLNYGIFLLSGVGAYLLFRRPRGKMLSAAAIVYGVALALTFDEFGMWLHLGGPYWQRASFDAVTVIAALLGLYSYAPSLARFRPQHWWTAALLLVMLVLFGAYLTRAFRHAKEKYQPVLLRIESSGPT
jgi:hypothetical protein